MNNTKERPIVLTAQEVNAVLAGNKTQYRVPFDFEFIKDVNVPIVQKVADETNCTLSELVTGAYQDGSVYDFDCPFGKVGDRLWVQEPTLAIEDVGWIGPVFVASDDGRNAMDWGYGPYDDPAHIPACELTYKNPCDLSHEDSRILLEITDIRIERLKDVSEDDAIAQGVKRQGKSWVNYKFLTDSHCAIDARTSFATFWQSNNGDNSWDLNPWVWVIEFKVIKPSEVQGG